MERKRRGTKDRRKLRGCRRPHTECGKARSRRRILRRKRREATALQERLGVALVQTDKTRAVEQGVLSGRLGDLATAAEAELFAIFAIKKSASAADYGLLREAERPDRAAAASLACTPTVRGRHA
eukprot:4641114-Pleurochrysis_carterae.AAC.1